MTAAISLHDVVIGRGKSRINVVLFDVSRVPAQFIGAIMEGFNEFEMQRKGGILSVEIPKKAWRHNTAKELLKMASARLKRAKRIRRDNRNNNRAGRRRPQRTWVTSTV